MKGFLKNHKIFSVFSFFWLFASLPFAESFEEYNLGCGAACFVFSWWLFLMPVWIYSGFLWFGLTLDGQRVLAAVKNHLKKRGRLYCLILVFLSVSITADAAYYAYRKEFYFRIADFVGTGAAWVNKTEFAKLESECKLPLSRKTPGSYTVVPLADFDRTSPFYEDIYDDKERQEKETIENLTENFAKKHEKPLASDYATEYAKRELEVWKSSPYLRKYIEEPDKYRMTKISFVEEFLMPPPVSPKKSKEYWLMKEHCS